MPTFLCVARSSRSFTLRHIAGNRAGFAHSSAVRKAVPSSLDSATHPQSHNDGDRQILRMLMFGKPGAGKGTLSARLVHKYDILALSTGDMLRQHINEGTEVGKQAEQIVASGGLLPDEVMLNVVTSKLDALHDKHWLLDGFPRTLGQGQLLDSHLQKQGNPLSLIINLDVPDDVILDRISDRWVHLRSGRVYNVSYNPPKVDGRDNETGEPLSKRPDDNPETFSRRLKKFYEATSPLLCYYDSLQSERSSLPDRKFELVSLRGRTSDEIWPQLDAAVQRLFPGLKERPGWKESKKRHSLSDAVLSERDRLSASVDTVDTVRK